MIWIESHVALVENPKFIYLCALLKMPKYSTCGLVHFLWHFTMKFAWRDGDISKYNSLQIALACQWDGEPDHLVSCLVESGFLQKTENGHKIANWDNYANKLIRDRLRKEAQTGIKYGEKNRKSSKTTDKRPPVDLQSTSGSSPDDLVARYTNTNTNTNIISKEETHCSYGKENKETAELNLNIPVKNPLSLKTHFIKPSLDDVVNYCKERGRNVNASRWFNYYESNGWKVGKNPMKDWKAAVRTWERDDEVKKEPVPMFGIGAKNG